MDEPAFDRNDTTLLFEVLFDIKVLIAKLVELVEGGGEDGREEPEDTDE